MSFDVCLLSIGADRGFCKNNEMIEFVRLALAIEVKQERLAK